VPLLRFAPVETAVATGQAAERNLFGTVLCLPALQSWAERSGHRLPTAWRSAGSRALSADAQQRLADAMQRLLDTSLQGADAQALDAMAERVIAALFACMKSSRETLPRGNSLARDAAVVRRARSLMLDPQLCITSAEQLGEHLGMNRRGLQQCFRAVLGITPLAYVLAARLHALRSALCDPALRHLRLDDLAARHEFRNLDHLIQGYRRQFGETPAQTRLRVRHAA